MSVKFDFYSFLRKSSDANALVTLLFIAIFAFASTKGILFGVVNGFINNQFMIDISSNLSNFTLNIYFVLAILVLLLAYFVKKVKRVFSLYDGVIIGFLVGLSWFISGYIGAESIEKRFKFKL